MTQRTRRTSPTLPARRGMRWGAFRGRLVTEPSADVAGGCPGVHAARAIAVEDLGTGADHAFLHARPPFGHPVF